MKITFPIYFTQSIVKHTITWIYILVFLLLAPTIKNHAQVRDIALSSTSKKAISHYKKGEKCYISNQFDDAIVEINRSLTIDDQFIEAWLLAGDNYRSLSRSAEAIMAYKKAIAIDSTFFPAAYYFIGNLLLEQGLYGESIQYFETFLLFDKVRPELQLQVLDKLAHSKFGNFELHNPKNDKVSLMSDSINNESDEYVNFIRYDNAQLMFTRRFIYRDGLTEKFYLSDLQKDVWQKAYEWSLQWPEIDQTGALTISQDGNNLYFAACGWDDSYGRCDLYSSSFINDQWTEPINMGPTINSNGWESQPCISSDGTQLYFVSDRKGGFGGSDIWKSVKLNDGTWSQAINLGEILNSSENEMAPYLHADGRTLYFSSTGLIGMGKADIFISRLDKAGRWSKPINLGYPVNTKDDEINIIFNSVGDLAFISSQRHSGKGGFDIYQVLVDSMHRPTTVRFLKGIVRDAITKKNLESDYKITQLEDESEMMRGQTSVSSGTFVVPLPSGETYSLLIEKQGYCLHTEHFDLLKVIDNKPFELEIFLQPVQIGSTIVLNNVFFDVNQSELKPDSFVELNQLVVYLKNNPAINIEIGGHTDSDGEERYNLVLSSKRAESVFNYLIINGIPASRMIFRGYGSSVSVATNETMEGKALNRRTEMKIIKN